MKLFKKIAILFCCVIGIQSVYAQKLTSFSHDSVKFLSEIEDYLYSGLADKSQVKDFVNKFSITWKSNVYDSYYKNETYKIADEMLAKKVQVYPTFQSFLVSMVYFVKSDLSEAQFGQWIECVEKLMKNRPYNNLTNFLSVSENLFATREMFKTTTYSWSANNANYTFHNDSAISIVFSKLDLKCTNEHNDTLIIYGTKGVYYPLRGTWIGEGGQTDWTRTGLAAADVYAELKNYKITFKEGGFVADSVTFWNHNYFDKPLEGKVIERNITEPKEKESFPRFISYGKRFTIPNLTNDVTYNGGFTMRGRRFVGSGTREEPAELIFKRNNKPFLITQAAEYSITKDNISTDDARITILLDGDSIYHPDIQMIYNINRKHLSLIRSSQGLSQAPFFDTYHKVNMFFEELSWSTEDTRMEFRMLEGTTQNTGDFESQDFFRPELFEKLRDPSGESPIVQIAKYTKTINSRDMPVADLAGQLHSTTDDVYPTLFILAKIGLVTLDVQANTVHVEDKLFRFIDDRSGKADYDVLDYHSTNPGKVYKKDTARHRENLVYNDNDSTGKDNGTMNLSNYDISLNGITYVVLSDSQNVLFYPDNRHIVLHRNREATFSGEVDAGKFAFFGKQFDFDYDNFKIKMKNVDSLRLYATAFKKDSTGKNNLVPVKSLIRHLSGELLIDKTTNRSGLKQLKNYPIIVSDTTTFVYYDKKDIQHGVYKKENFYFKADPFTIDSLSSFSNTRLKFDGSLTSADIAPELKETLKLQPDYSLGFVHKAAVEGIPVYKGKGTLFDTLKLSNQGLRGSGSLKYITSTTQSKNFIYFPDSMDVRAGQFEVAEQKTEPEFAEAHGDSVYEHWTPYQDHLFATDMINPFTCYNKFATFHGTYTVSPNLLSGSGRMDFLKAFLTSVNFKFKQHRVTADTADFSLKGNDNIGIAFATNNMNTDIDFEKRLGEFVTNGSGSVVKFIENQYIAYMDEFKWYIDQDAIDLGAKKVQQAEIEDAKELQFSGSKFISVEPHQDSLQFITPQARFSLKTYEISAHEVPFIDVADARIVPDSGNITVHRKAYMDPFHNATITANNVTKYYTIYKANLTITSRKIYSGSGYCDYVDELKRKMPIYFDNIHVDTSHQTVAIANINDTGSFSLSPHFAYKGKVILKASNPFFTFDGFTRINHQCDELKITWVKFSSQVDPNDIQISVANQVNESMVPLASGPIMTAADSLKLYPTFLSPIVRYKTDLVVIPDSGFLTFDKASQEYRISNKEKLVEQSLPGNYVSLDTRKCILYGEGKLNLGPYYPMLDMKTLGNITDYLTPDSVTSSISMVLNFFFDEVAIEKMAGDANGFSTLKPVDYSNGDIQMNLRELMGKEEADKLISQLTLYGTLKKVPKEMQSTLFLTDVKLKWDAQLHAYLSYGTIGVGTIGKTMVNKEAEGKIELIKNRGLMGDELYIYLAFDPMHWYYFQYRGGSMLAYSSNQDFLHSIDAVKPDKRDQKTDKGKYTYGTAQAEARAFFLKRTNGH